MPTINLGDYLTAPADHDLRSTSYGHLGTYELAEFLAGWDELHHQALAHLPYRIHPTAYVHPNAIIGDDVVIGPHVRVWEFSTIRAGSVLCAGVSIGFNCEVTKSFIGEGSVLGMWSPDMRRPEHDVFLRTPEGIYRCGTPQFGALIGDRVQTGNNISLGPRYRPRPRLPHRQRRNPRSLHHPRPPHHQCTAHRGRPRQTPTPMTFGHRTREPVPHGRDRRRLRRPARPRPQRHRDRDQHDPQDGDGHGGPQQQAGPAERPSGAPRRSRSETESLPRAVRTQSARHPIKTVALHREQSRKSRVSDLQQGSLQVADPADYLETKKAAAAQGAWTSQRGPLPRLLGF
ncbi:hypothetical protein [Streptomyces sp. NPDC005283]|uniref:hypothetical protein n=1 Tax=Streptomyces sp. NPDC005283 TaxID=3156871 RepID=UPI003456E8F5